jgi:hypothetical protein
MKEGLRSLVFVSIFDSSVNGSIDIDLDTEGGRGNTGERDVTFEVVLNGVVISSPPNVLEGI